MGWCINLLHPEAREGLQTEREREERQDRDGVMKGKKAVLQCCMETERQLVEYSTPKVIHLNLNVVKASYLPEFRLR